ncbi:MAG TPA: cytochrome d ubiquinol oxidase subunit II [Solirubrobacteraceae bacterium]|nr:cytochrome d ubiquinol oxidase subunit II [Solirubrobacteraceae bacterium]
MHPDPSFLQTLWFVLIGVLWAGYFVLEGFDFGVGMLVRVLGRDDTEKRLLIHTVGPIWDGNEVWLLVAGGATFAAFPGWYATTFSGFYLALFLVLAALIVRGVSFEFWGKVPSARWRGVWEWALALSSGLAALLFGVAWANFIHGVPMNASHQMTATLWDLLHPYPLLGGLATLTLFLAHGAGFLTLRTEGEIHARAVTMARRLAPVGAALTLLFVVATMVDQSFSAGVVVLGALAAVALIVWVQRAQHGVGATAFAASTAVVLLFTAMLLVALFPNALPSTTSHANDLTLVAASSTPYTLTVMTVVAVLFLPVVLGYQAWTYWVFRHRLGRDQYEGAVTPIAVLQARQKAGAGSGGAPAGAA